jgi:hypothetical protein
MKKCTIFRSKRYGPTKKVVLALSLTGAALIVTIPVAWAYEKINLGVGMEAAQVTVAFQVFVVLVLTAVGMGLGYLMDWAIRRRKSVFRLPQEGSCAEALVRLWGYEMTCQEEDEYTMIPEINLLPTFDEVLDMINRPKRRGRKPTFPLEAWLPIAAKWENRDPIRDAFTLEDLIRESLGENSDGSPVVSAQSYYSTWRERALEEMKRQAEAKQAASQSNQDRPTE